MNLQSFWFETGAADAALLVKKQFESEEKNLCPESVAAAAAAPTVAAWSLKQWRPQLISARLTAVTPTLRQKWAGLTFTDEDVALEGETRGEQAAGNVEVLEWFTVGFNVDQVWRFFLSIIISLKGTYFSTWI